MRPGLQFPSFPNSKSNAAECTVKSTKLGGEGGIEEGTSFQAASLGFTVENMICRKFACADNDAHKDDTELIDVSVMVEEGDDQPLLNFGVLPVESILGDTKASRRK
uniref:Putative ovule protein n=1 Tax=Solanum chacoense TaxID=4108 RepID=A0A0V0GM04_SOLCH